MKHLLRKKNPNEHSSFLDFPEGITFVQSEGFFCPPGSQAYEY